MSTRYRLLVKSIPVVQEPYERPSGEKNVDWREKFCDPKSTSSRVTQKNVEEVKGRREFWTDGRMGGWEGHGIKGGMRDELYSTEKVV